MSSSEFAIYKAIPQSGDAKRSVHLITRKADPGLAQLLADSFPEVVKSEPFLKALVRYNGLPDTAASELKVADIGK